MEAIALLLHHLTKSVRKLSVFLRLSPLTGFRSKADRVLNFLRACGASDEDQSLWGIGNSPSFTKTLFVVFEVNEKVC